MARTVSTRWPWEASVYYLTRLREMPVWPFSSGPIGDSPKPAEGPSGIPELERLTGAKEHRLFGGRLDRGELGLVGRAVVAALRVTGGANRDFGEIEVWANGIAGVFVTRSARA